MTHASSIYDALLSKKQTLSVAESCTGGLISWELVKQAGISKVFKGSIVCYSSQVKIELLQIPLSLIKEKSAVCEDVALLLAQNVKEKLKSDWGLSVTGWAGPEGGEQNNPVGTIIFGFSGPQIATTKKIKLESLPREALLKKATELGLKEFKEILTK